MRSRLNSRLGWSLLASTTALFLSFSPASAGYVEFNLDSDIPGDATFTEPTLVNPWGMAASPTSPWWLNDNGTGLATIYNGNTGVRNAGLVVTIPPPENGTPPSAPTGMVFNGSTGFVLPNGTKASFIFSTEDGTIAGWNGGASAIIEAQALPKDPVFKGLAIGKAGGNDYLYASDFHNAKVQVFDTTFKEVDLAGSFTDPTLPDGYAPFGIQNIGGLIYVSYAKQTPGSGDETDGPHLGFVSVFNPDGTFVKRVASNGALDAPWGMVLAPADFGPFGGDLLVGNFGDGKISAFDPVTNAFLGNLPSPEHFGLTIDGLWGLGFGNGVSSGPTNSLFFTAGIDGEAHGLFGDLKFVKTPEPATLTLFSVGLAGLGAWRRRKARKD